MSGSAPFEPIAQLLERSLSIRHVYGEPVQHGDITVIPVARVAYLFGAGGGRGPSRGATDLPARAPGEAAVSESQGAGGGGGVKMTPAGALEIGPQGTRFVSYRPLAPLGLAAAFGMVVGWLFWHRG